MEEGGGGACTRLTSSGHTHAPSKHFCPAHIIFLMALPSGWLSFTSILRPPGYRAARAAQTHARIPHGVLASDTYKYLKCSL
jgi:hypothetical protein